MSRTGYVLVGGRSSRMGRDKSLLPFRGVFLAQYVAAQVAAAAGSATLVGDPEMYASLGFPVIPDTHPGLGPLAGIHAALLDTRADWNLVVACDMPGVTRDFLSGLLDAAGRSEADAVIPVAPDGTTAPVCAAYHRRALPAVAAALDAGVRRMSDALTRLTVERWPVEKVSHLQNVNTPEEWAGTWR